MSERGSFVTEYIYCKDCLAVAKEILIGDHKGLCSAVIPINRAGDCFPIIAGKLGGLYAGEELHDMEDEFGPALVERLCHPLRIAVLAEHGERIFRFVPGVFEEKESLRRQEEERRKRFGTVAWWRPPEGISGEALARNKSGVLRLTELRRTASQSETGGESVES